MNKKELEKKIKQLHIFILDMPDCKFEIEYLNNIHFHHLTEAIMHLPTSLEEIQEKDLQHRISRAKEYEESIKIIPKQQPQAKLQNTIQFAVNSEGKLDFIDIMGEVKKNSKNL